MTVSRNHGPGRLHDVAQRDSSGLDGFRNGEAVFGRVMCGGAWNGRLEVTWWSKRLPTCLEHVELFVLEYVEFDDPRYLQAVREQFQSNLKD